MHGRVKVRTSEEEKAKKEKERQEKLKAFKHAMNTIQVKRKESVADKDLLDLTGKVLSSNPDIYTLWNIRRETINSFRKNYGSEEELSQVFDTELQLTEYCLKVNPKSYGAWHHREWVLTTRSDPDWSKELALCNTYLKWDERNFHTWDYRRFVVSQCKPSLKDEFDFTTEKLHDNFSNYSAWHYRSKMLIELYPDLEGGRPIEDSHHKHELKMVQSAAFTDPDDTSAWFYQRWLLGAVKSRINPVVYIVTASNTSVAFNKYVNKDFVTTTTRFLINNESTMGNWVSCTGNQYDVLWLFIHQIGINDSLDVKLEYTTEDREIQTIASVKYGNSVYIGKTNIDFQRHYSAPVIEELNNQLESCRQLLALEPDNKWTLLTTTVFLHCIDAKHNLKEVVDNLDLLKKIDPLRAGYYEDMICKWSIEDQLYRDYKSNSLQYKIKFTRPVSCLPHLQYYSYCEDVDLSNQNLSSNVLPSLQMLLCCKILSLENNKLTTLTRFPKLQLQQLNIRGNKALDENEVEKLKHHMTCQVIY